MEKWIFTVMLIGLFLTGCSITFGGSMIDETQAPAANFVTEPTVSEESILPAETDAVSKPELLTALIDPKDDDFVLIRHYIPDLFVDLKYASSDNFTGQVIYKFDDVFLRYGTVKKLKAASEELALQGLYFKIWDGFRPVSAQFTLWDVCPDSTYVANPNKGFSNHSRGYAVDLTLVDAQGREVVMPTEFDDFSAKADRDYSDCSSAAAENARLLERMMEKHGFQGYWGEWWHFNDTRKYDVETCFDPGVISRRSILEETDLLKDYADTDSEVLRIPAGEKVTILGYIEEYALTEYWGYRGYVAQNALRAAE